ncbi:MAG: hypothetical protein ACFFEF_04790 [Candidatus Thorarchaeota archaeon]
MSNHENDKDEDRKRRKSSEEAEELREIAKTLPELFNTLNEAIPKMISGIIGSVYSPEAAANMGAAVGKFYSQLVAEGIPEDVALEMTKKFVGALDFQKIVGMVSSEVDNTRFKKKTRLVDDDWEEEDDE